MPGHELPESRLRPFPAAMTVRQARDAYLEENGFSLDAYDADWNEVRMLGRTFRVPNTEIRRRAIRLHDLHHAATGYGTDVFGEIEVSAWECRGGLQGLGLFVRGIVVGFTLFGLLIAPLRTWRAWSAGAAGGRNLFGSDEDYETLLDTTLGELRERLGLPPAGLFRGPRRLHETAPGRVAAENEDDDAPRTGIAILTQVALLLSGLAAYLLLSETGSGRDDGYAFVVAIHLLILAATCVVFGVRLAAVRASGS